MYQKGWWSLDAQNSPRKCLTIETFCSSESTASFLQCACFACKYVTGGPNTPLPPPWGKLGWERLEFPWWSPHHQHTPFHHGHGRPSPPCWWSTSLAKYLPRKIADGISNFLLLRCFIMRCFSKLYDIETVQSPIKPFFKQQHFAIFNNFQSQQVTHDWIL